MGRSLLKMVEGSQEKPSRSSGLLGRFLLQLPVGRGVEISFSSLCRGKNGDICDQITMSSSDRFANQAAPLAESGAERAG